MSVERLRQRAGERSRFGYKRLHGRFARQHGPLRPVVERVLREFLR